MLTYGTITSVIMNQASYPKYATICRQNQSCSHLRVEQLNRGTIKGDEARLDVRARGFWRRGQNAYFDVRVTNANAESAKTTTVKNVLSKHEREKNWHLMNES